MRIGRSGTTAYTLFLYEDLPEKRKGHESEIEQRNGCVSNKEHKIPMIGVTHTVVNPWALHGVSQ